MKITIAVGDHESRTEYGGTKQYFLYILKGADAKGSSSLTKVPSISKEDTPISNASGRPSLKDGPACTFLLFRPNLK
jgi:hypothetical protein